MSNGANIIGVNCIECPMCGRVNGFGSHEKTIECWNCSALIDIERRNEMQNQQRPGRGDCDVDCPWFNEDTMDCDRRQREDTNTDWKAGALYWHKLYRSLRREMNARGISELDGFICPECGGYLNVDTRIIVFCPFCGRPQKEAD